MCPCAHFIIFLQALRGKVCFPIKRTIVYFFSLEKLPAGEIGQDSNIDCAKCSEICHALVKGMIRVIASV